MFICVKYSNVLTVDLLGPMQQPCESQLRGRAGAEDEHS